MPFLTDAYIETVLGGNIAGARKYAAIAPTDAVKAQYIQMADMAVVSHARKGGYSSVSAGVPSVPATGEAFQMLQAMSFKHWARIAYGYGKDISVPDTVASSLPDSSDLYKSADDGRIDLPGLDRDQLGGDGGASIANGDGISTLTSEQVFSRVNLRLF